VLRLVSQEHLRESMKYLRKSPQDPLTPAVLREIGLREGTKLISREPLQSSAAVT
jgi:hypothetical protein